MQEAGWAPGPVGTGAENLAPTGIRSPDRPASLYTDYATRPTYDQKGADLSSIHPWRYELTKFRLASWFALSCHKCSSFVRFCGDCTDNAHLLGKLWQTFLEMSPMFSSGSSSANTCLTVWSSFPSTVPQNIVTGSAHNSGINKEDLLNTAKKFQISLDISRKFLSGNWQYWSKPLHFILPVFSGLYTFSQLGVPCDGKNTLRVPPLNKKVEKLWSKVKTVARQFLSYLWTVFLC